LGDLTLEISSAVGGGRVFNSAFTVAEKSDGSFRVVSVWERFPRFAISQTTANSRMRAAIILIKEKLLVSVVERTFAWLNQFRRLRVRYEKRADMHEAFLSLGCALICWYALRKSCANG
jgi:DDE family transposase